MRSLLETISKERKVAPPISTRTGESKEKKRESKTVAVQTDFPAQLLESYVVKHKARWVFAQVLGNLQELTGCCPLVQLQKTKKLTMQMQNVMLPVFTAQIQKKI